MIPLLVVDEENKLRGIVGRKDLFKATRPLMPAEDIMHDVAYVAHVGDSIVNVLKMVEESEVNNIPVLDQEERLVGLLTNSNLVSTLSKQFLTDDNTEGMVIEK